jgi:ATP-dependent DNA helicase HFM1/MER3
VIDFQGKSTIFDMAMARFFEIDISISSQQVVSKARKILYVAPSKALCEERYEDWSSRLKAMNIGVEVALITGDAADPGSSFSDLTSAHLVISTPEKWDSMTRRWSENFFLFASVKLLLLDEVHLLGDLNRGWCLESVVTRMKTIHCATQRLHVSQDEINESSYSATNPDAIHSSFRMIAVSATLPNIRDVADFLMANEAHGKFQY